MASSHRADPCTMGSTQDHEGRLELGGFDLVNRRIKVALHTHCMASCLIKSNCGQPQAVVAGASKELFDTVACVFTLKRGSCTSAFQSSDFDDNFTGATCSNDMSCWDCCASLKGVPDRPGGPLSCLGMWGK
jgi:hypothetical protein